ncbi:FAD-dependent oxidoreductase [Micromonospora sp. CPCC 206060]|uniref:FAD-dependent oxidoreductase n=1 Tax=Micromonospora sp. CPCC 206060 TaxID=3122406 RepID=UPI002FF0E9BE
MNAFRFAVVGAGPAGAYAVGALLAQTDAVGVPCDIDLLDRLPTPWGLVRSGVAPDHPQIKSVIRVFERIVDHPAVRFLGGVQIGRDLSHRELLDRYDAVVYATGAPVDRQLDIPGTGLAGCLPAGRFVRWYNGHPDASTEQISLDTHRAVVVGNGNVAIDCARLLIQDPEDLCRTDIANPALAVLAESRIREVVVLGRRDPGQASFTLPELHQLGRLRGVDITVDAPSLTGDGPVLDALRSLAARPAQPGRRLTLRFQVSPTAVVGHGHVEALDLVHNEIVDGRARPTTRHERIDCGFVVHAVGFGGSAIPGVPFDDVHGRVANTGGRVAPRVYVAGWAKRGPSGVIGTNKRCATETASAIVADITDGTLRPRHHDRDSALTFLHDRSPSLVTLDGWRRIDAAEVAAGLPHGRPRIKFTSGRALADAARGDRH